MNCHRVQSQLSAYIDQELNGDERRSLRNHLAQCPVCDSEFQALSELKQLMGSLSAPVPPESLWTALHRHINGVDAIALTGPWWANNVRHLSLTAACFTLFLMTSLLIFPQKSSTVEMVSNKREAPMPMAAMERASTQRLETVSLDEEFSAPKKKTIHETRIFYNHGYEQVLTGVTVSRW